jgi:CheY-like chemotaxis protein
MEQVVLNLAVNARDAMPQGGELAIETRNVDLDERFVATHVGANLGPHVTLAVSDNGIGIPAEHLDRIFEPFFSTRPAGEGTGLGLSTVYGIVQQNGGCVFPYSEVGQGTTLKIMLPAVPERAAEPGPAAEFEDDPTGTERILVVEDDAAVRSFVEEVLVQAGYRVRAVAGGAEALEVALEDPAPPDLLLTDVLMPEMSGDEVARMILLKLPDLKILYMSGHTWEAMHGGGHLVPAKDLVEKPFSVRQLLCRVRGALDSQSR